MRIALDILSFVGVALTSLLAVATATLRRRHRGEAAAWAGATFVALAMVAIAGLALRPLHPGAVLHDIFIRGVIAILVLFPYLLFRFAVAFEPVAPWAVRSATAVTGAVVLWGLLLPVLPDAGAPRPRSLVVYTIAVVLQWLVLTVTVAVRLWRGGRGLPAVARRRTQLLALGAAGMAVLIVIAALAPSTLDPRPIDLVRQVAFLLTTSMFFVGLAPPQILREMWRYRERQRLQSAVVDLMTATTAGEVATIIVPGVAGILGARAAALFDRDGEVIEVFGMGREEAARALGEPGGSIRAADVRVGRLVVWMGPYAPFFGDKEAALFRSFQVVADLAFERTELLARERDFIANAAHELRTPLTAVTGLTAMLAERWQDLTPEQLADSLAALGRQGARAGRLVDVMLDLSALEHRDTEVGAVAVAEVAGAAVAAAPPPAGRTVSVEVDGLVALAERDRLEQVLINLLTNAYRYGGPAVTVDGSGAGDGWVHVTVADDGPGVPPTIAREIFEPFKRAPNGRAEGTGLGLTITRRMVEALGGTIVYEPGHPTGARFVVRLRAAA